ncbi:hypothetical protein LX32DRAFT_703712 [Colletotrichum zoysiae]|uniref:Uncharacterized protein n=1 Tax=Colletotrichum zoysiae TaxID=1216348 RepID=A0AAD9HAG8_9PEZI|nr:hypothetical protein LX32DRAFT_703712 [Colletotrichum zoysiae]
MTSDSAKAAKPALHLVRRYTDQMQQEGSGGNLGQALATKVDLERRDEAIGRTIPEVSALDSLEIYQGTNVGLFKEGREKLNAKSSSRSGKIKSCFYLKEINTPQCCQVPLLRDALGANPRHQYIKWQVSKFYCHFFRFLVLILTEWLSCSSKRFFNSFGDGLLSACDTAVKKMTACKDDIMHRIILIQQRAIMDMNTKLDQLGSLVQASLVGTAIDRSRLCDAPRASSTPKLASLQTLPQSHSTDARYENKVNTKSEGSDQRWDSSDGIEKVEPELAGDELAGASELWTLERMQESLKHLETFHQVSRIAYLTSPVKQVSGSAEMRADLVKMASSRRSAALWIEGPAHMVHDLSQLSIPTLFHFVHRPKNASLDRERALLEMTRPEVTRSLAPAVNLFESLLRSPPPLLFCVVDGFQLLVRDSNSLELKAASKQFVACICKAATYRPTDQPQIFKSLWTTDGFCKDLQQARKSQVLAHVGYEDDEDYESLALRGREMSPLIEG